MTPQVQTPPALTLSADGDQRARARDRLLTAVELSERWQVPTAQVYRLARDHRLPVVAIGRYKRFRLAVIEAWECDGGASAND